MAIAPWPLDVVALLEDLPWQNLRRGQVGMIVDVCGPDVFEVEFSDDTGKIYAMAALHVEQLLALHYEPATTGA